MCLHAIFNGQGDIVGLVKDLGQNLANLVKGWLMYDYLFWLNSTLLSSLQLYSFFFSWILGVNGGWGRAFWLQPKLGNFVGFLIHFWVNFLSLFCVILTKSCFQKAYCRSSAVEAQSSGPTSPDPKLHWFITVLQVKVVL